MKLKIGDRVLVKSCWECGPTCTDIGETGVVFADYTGLSNKLGLLVQFNDGRYNDFAEEDLELVRE